MASSAQAQPVAIVGVGYAGVATRGQSIPGFFLRGATTISRARTDAPSWLVEGEFTVGPFHDVSCQGAFHQFCLAPRVRVAQAFLGINVEFHPRDADREFRYHPGPIGVGVFYRSIGVRDYSVFDWLCAGPRPGCPESGTFEDVGFFIQAGQGFALPFRPLSTGVAMRLRFLFGRNGVEATLPIGVDVSW